MPNLSELESEPPTRSYSLSRKDTYRPESSGWGDKVRRRAAPSRPHPTFGTLARPSHAQFKAYVAIEAGVWLPGLYLLCYRFRPTIRFVETRTGAELVRRAGDWLQRWSPSQHEKIARLSGRIYGSPNGRTFAEWLLLNKVLTPVALPSKLFLANWIVQKQRRYAGITPPTPPTPARFLAGETSKS